MATLTDRQLAGYIKRSKWPAQEHATVFAVIVGESGKRTHVINSTGHKGLMQISPLHGDMPGNPLNALDNINMGYTVWKRQGWGAWVVHSEGIYKQYLDRANKALGNPADVLVGTTPGSASAGSSGVLGAIGLITDPHTYLRVAAFIAGGLLIVLALARAMGVGAGDVIQMAVLKRGLSRRR